MFWGAERRLGKETTTGLAWRSAQWRFPYKEGLCFREATKAPPDRYRPMPALRGHSTQVALPARTQGKHWEARGMEGGR